MEDIRIRYRILVDEMKKKGIILDFTDDSSISDKDIKIYYIALRKYYIQQLQDLQLNFLLLLLDIASKR